MNPWEAIQRTLDQFYGGLWQIATALAGVGIATMALLQVIKDVGHLHWYFNRHEITRWLQHRARMQNGADSERVFVRAHTSLIALATAGDERVLYSLDTPQLTGQIAAAAQVVMDHPTEYPDLYRCLAAQASGADVDRLLQTPPQPASATAGEDEKSARQRELTPWIDAKNRVGHQIQRALDGLQIAIDYRWKYLNQVIAFVLNAVFVAVALSYILTPASARDRVTSVLAWLFLTILSGFLAPVAKDLVSALQQLKGRAR